MKYRYFVEIECSQTPESMARHCNSMIGCPVCSGPCPFATSEEKTCGKINKEDWEEFLEKEEKK